MKINTAGSVRTNTTRRKNGADSAAAGDFAAHISPSGGARSPAVSGATQLGSVEALIALQAGGGSTDGRARAEIDRAEDLLSRLDQIRVGILTGNLSSAVLESIVVRLDARRREGVEPRLAAIIDEIEVRAKVELAKLSMMQQA